MNTNMNTNTNNPVYIERIKFYADTPRGEKNKYFCFKTDLLNLEAALFRFFEKGFLVRAAWYEKINTETGEIENLKLDLQTSFNRFMALYPKKRKIV